MSVDKKSRACLIGLLRREASSRVLIFTNMRRTAQRLGELLQSNGISAAPITGDMEQRQRLRILDRFKAGELPVLVATDVASRGLHIEAVTHVINYDLPQDPEDYVHRTGRTARAGATGEAVSLVSEEDVDALEPIERLIGFKLAFVIPDDSVLAPVVHLGKRRSREERPKPRDRSGRAARANEGRRRTRDPRPERPQAHSQAQTRSHGSGQQRRGPQSQRRSTDHPIHPPLASGRRRHRQARRPPLPDDPERSATELSAALRAQERPQSTSRRRTSRSATTKATTVTTIIHAKLPRRSRPGAPPANARQICTACVRGRTHATARAQDGRIPMGKKTPEKRNMSEIQG